MGIKKTDFIAGVVIALFPDLILAADYVVAVRSKSGVEKSVKAWQPTLDYLSEKISYHNFSLMPVVSLNEITQLAIKGEIDFLFTNPSSFIEVKNQTHATALATLNNRRSDTAQSHFGSVVFTHAKNEHILSLDDLKGKRVMAVSEPAFGGWRVAWLEMLEYGIDPKRDFDELLFAGGLQNKVVHAVYDGIADVGVVRTDQLERMEVAGEIDMRYFRILNNKDTKSFPFFLSTPLYPEWPFVLLNEDVPEDTISDVRRALLELPDDSDAAKAGKYVGWIEPLDYTPVDSLLRKLRTGPYEN